MHINVKVEGPCLWKNRFNNLKGYNSRVLRNKIGIVWQFCKLKKRKRNNEMERENETT